MKKHIRALFSEFDIDSRILDNVSHCKKHYENVRRQHNADKGYQDQVRTEYEEAEREFRTAVHKVLSPITKPSARLNKIDTE